MTFTVGSDAFLDERMRPEGLVRRAFFGACACDDSI